MLRSVRFLGILFARNVTKRIICLLFGTLIILASVDLVWAQGSPGMSREEKLRMIDKDIQVAQDGKKSGIIKVVAGVGLYALSYAFIPITTATYSSYSGYDEKTDGNAALWGICLVGGLVCEVWGTWQWWSNAQELSMLKVKRFDLTFQPMLMPRQDIAYGVGMNFRLK